ncbi:MAG: hypothetical protein JRE81_11665, partial [Deltaproteobacteria bacterium]|nr:hypothetical protein [Deltaproteobacteria bacterium]
MSKEHVFELTALISKLAGGTRRVTKRETWAPSLWELERLRVDLGNVPKSHPRLMQNLAKFDEPLPKPTDDSHSVVTRAMTNSLTTSNHLSSVVEAVGIEQPGAHPIPTILERFRGQVSTKTRPNNT